MTSGLVITAGGCVGQGTSLDCSAGRKPVGTAVPGAQAGPSCPWLWRAEASPVLQAQRKRPGKSSPGAATARAPGRRRAPSPRAGAGGEAAGPQEAGELLLQVELRQEQGQGGWAAPGLRGFLGGAAEPRWGWPAWMPFPEPVQEISYPRGSGNFRPRDHSAAQDTWPQDLPLPFSLQERVHQLTPRQRSRAGPLRKEK